jgi:hypothetical protein
MAAAASGERVVEVDGEMTGKIFDELHLKPGEVKCVFMGNDEPARITLNAVLTSLRPMLPGSEC